MSAYSKELRAAMTRRGVKPSTLADRIGYGRTNLRRILDRDVLPTVEVAQRLAEELEWPSLATKAVEARTGTCELCGATFVRAPRGHSRRFCGSRCKGASHARRARDSMRTKTLTETRLTRKRLEDFQLAVLAMCRGCEPEGRCRDADCALRPVSPLTLADVRVRVA